MLSTFWHFFLTKLDGIIIIQVFLDISSQLLKELGNGLEFVQSTLRGAVNLREAAVNLGRLQ